MTVRLAVNQTADPSLNAALLIAALACGCALMSPLLRAGPLALDEHGSYWLVKSDLPGTALERSLGYAAIPPLSAWLEQAFFALFGQSELVFRLPSALCYLAAIGMTWLVASQLADRTAGGLAAMLLAWHPDLDEVRIARCYGLLMLLGAVLLWCTVRWRRHPHSWRWPVLWGGAAAALMWTHYVALPLIGMVWLTLLLRPDKPQQARIRVSAVAAASVIAALLCLPLAPAILRMREWSPFLNYMPEGQPWWKMLGPLWWAGVPAGIALALLLEAVAERGGRGSRRAATKGKSSFSSGSAGASPSRNVDSGVLNPLPRKRELPESIPLRRALLPALWTLVPLVCLLLLARGDLSSLANPRYRIPYAAGSACLIAVSLRALNPRLVTNAAAVIVVIGLTWSLAEARPWHLLRLGAPADIEWRDAARRIEELGVVGEPVFVQSGLVESSLVPALYEDALFLEYVGCRISRFYLDTRHPRIGLPYFWDSADMRAQFRQQMSPQDSTSNAFWVAAATDTDLNRASLAGIEQLARSAGFVVQDQQSGPNMTLLRYHRPAEEP